MKPVSRRSVTTGLAAAVTGLPAVGLCVSSEAGDKKLLELIRRYRGQMDAITRECDKRRVCDRELSRWMADGDTTLDQIITLPIRTRAGASAAMDLAIEGSPDEVGSSYILPEEHHLALLAMVRDYLTRSAATA